MVPPVSGISPVGRQFQRKVSMAHRDFILEEPNRLVQKRTLPVETILSSATDVDVRTAAGELFRYLCEKPRPAGPTSPKGQCAIAIDAGNECLVEIFSSFLPAEWQQRITIATYTGFTDVIRMVRDTLPALLVIHSNLILQSEEAIAASVAVSPGTRYLLLTAWAREPIEQLHKACAPLRISMGTLSMPFSREQFLAALSSAAGDALP